MASPTRFHSSKTTLGAAVEAFFADRDLAPATRRAYRATYGSLIQAFGTEMPVTALTAVNLQHWLIRRWGKRSPATWNARLAASRVLIGYCQRQGWIEHDPTRSLERRRTPRDETRAIPFAALAEQLFDIAQRERVPKVPAHGAKNQLRLRLSPLGDRRSDCLLHDLFRLPATVGQSCNTTHQIAERVRPRRIQYSLTAQCETYR